MEILVIIVGLIAVVIALVNLALFVMVLIKLFQEKGALHGVLGLLCSLYTFIWGWQNAKRLNITTIMIAWSGCIVLSIVLNIIIQGINASLQY
jgi:hypothetical protein